MIACQMIRRRTAWSSSLLLLCILILSHWVRVRCYNDVSQKLSSSVATYVSTYNCSRRRATCRNTMTMKIRVGILGLPNVGKSSLFNALARQSVAQAANYPFCTIDPNRAAIPLPDQYLYSLGRQHRRNHNHGVGTRDGANDDPVKTVPATMEWIDVAGLAKGAHRGEGLGNQFLATLRECQAICHVVRIFDDINAVVHVDGNVNPCSDLDTILLELMLADLDHAERRLARKASKSTHDNNVEDVELTTLEKVINGLQMGIPSRELNLTYKERFSIKSMGLLTLKPMLYAFNVDEVDYTLGRDQAKQDALHVLEQAENCDPIKESWTLVSAKLDSELSLLTEEEQVQYWSSLGFEEEIVSNEETDPTATTMSALRCHEILPTLVQRLLSLGVAYTGPGVPPERSRTIKAHIFNTASSSSTANKSGVDVQDNGPPITTAYELAGRLHGDIQKGFIRAEVTSASLLLQHPDYVSAKEAGCIRTEGKEYKLQDNDVILVKWK